jgi:hypothetical protein
VFGGASTIAHIVDVTQKRGVGQTSTKDPGDPLERFDLFLVIFPFDYLVACPRILGLPGHRGFFAPWGQNRGQNRGQNPLIFSARMAGLLEFFD